MLQPGPQSSLFLPAAFCKFMLFCLRIYASSFRKGVDSIERFQNLPCGGDSPAIAEVSLLAISFMVSRFCCSKVLKRWVFALFLQLMWPEILSWLAACSPRAASDSPPFEFAYHQRSLHLAGSAADSKFLLYRFARYDCSACSRYSFAAVVVHAGLYWQAMAERGLFGT